ncbi:MAG: SAVED domain-containing protein [Gammaproteobacteria bacterium]|nr:SAVED domain-containing protein [Gammaproteobacteria bacterium]MYK83826.1 SAVED domain-containing protein [Gammaproteobacteria bacterium]
MKRTAWIFPMASKVVEWMTRQRPVAHLMFWGGFLLLTSGIEPMWLLLMINMVVPTLDQALSITVEQAPVLVATRWVMLAVGTVFLSVSGWFYIHDWRKEARQLVLGVEILGLRDATAPPLTEAIPQTFRGTRMPIVVDLRQNIVDGELSDPDRALTEVAMLPARIKTQCQWSDRRDVQVVAGGLAPVPLLFLAGVLLDDESDVSLLDWDRHLGKWKLLDAPESGKRLETALALGDSEVDEVALCISVSYRVNLGAVSSLGLPMVHLELPTQGTAQHWSELDQQAWGEQFLELAMALEAKGVARIHLFLAAPGSVVLRMGRLYDKRNLPALRVYQYRRSAVVESPYPWAIEMPVAGHQSARVITL